MHAVIATVNIPPGQFETARKTLRDEIVPRVSKAPGFVKGYWTINGDQTRGQSTVVFDSKDHAEARADGSERTDGCRRDRGASMCARSSLTRRDSVDYRWL
jgi:hypothetical protein